MLDKEIVKLARDRIAIEIEEQNTQIQKELTRMVSEHNARGMLRSGSTIIRSSEICCNAVKARAQLVWQIYYRFITTSGVSYSEELQPELSALVASHLPERLGDISGFYNQTARHAGGAGVIEQGLANIGAARNTALSTIETEIGLFAHSLKAKPANAVESKSTIVNVYSPVGSIQTGNNSVAHVSQTIDVQTRNMLVSALTNLAAEVQKPECTIPAQKDEVIELVAESEQELKKDKPNFTKLKGALAAIAGTVQTTASLKPAYEALKVASGLIGINLP
ncbi:MAG: hypothetical protein Q7U82_04980 [Gammaproteobacteria bacterium]|nr:hypothetical protein [Gammaproteobacteria bacterium]